MGRELSRNIMCQQLINNVVIGLQGPLLASDWFDFQNFGIGPQCPVERIYASSFVF